VAAVIAVSNERATTCRAERADPFGAHRVALVGHGGGSDLLRFEGLFELPVVLEKAQIRADLVGRLREPRERPHDEVVLLARVGLSGDDLPLLETRPPRESHVELLDFPGIASEEKEERGLGTGRSLGSQEAQLAAGPTDRLEVHQEIGGPERGALSNRRRLRRLIVRVGERRQVPMREGEVPEPPEDFDEPAFDEREPLAHLHEIGVVRHVSRGRAPVQDPPGGRCGGAEDPTCAITSWRVRSSSRAAASKSMSVRCARSCSIASSGIGSPSRRSSSASQSQSRLQVSNLNRGEKMRDISADA
jgi:hypothetical protein